MFFPLGFFSYCVLFWPFLEYFLINSFCFSFCFCEVFLVIFNVKVFRCLRILFCYYPLKIENLLNSCGYLLLTNRLVSFSRVGFYGFVLVLISVLFSLQNYELLVQSGLSLLAFLRKIVFLAMGSDWELSQRYLNSFLWISEVVFACIRKTLLKYDVLESASVFIIITLLYKDKILCKSFFLYSFPFFSV